MWLTSFIAALEAFAAGGGDAADVSAVRVLSVSSSDAQGAWTIEFHKAVRPVDGPGARAFRTEFSATRYRGPSFDLAFDIERADSDTCPAILTVLDAFNRLEAPGFDSGPLYGAPPRGGEPLPAEPPPVDGRGFTIEGPAIQPGNTTATMRLTATDGLIAEAVILAETRLSECWRAPIAP